MGGPVLHCTARWHRVLKSLAGTFIDSSSGVVRLKSMGFGLGV